MVLFTGCATSPVGVKRMDAVDVHRTLTANALTEDAPSIDSKNVLHQGGLYLHFEKNTEWTLAQLHRIAVGENSYDVRSALAELSSLHSERIHDRKYSVLAALYAWAYLFGGDPVEPFDPRLRTATDLYNRGLTQGLEEGRKNRPDLFSQTMEIPVGDITIDFDPERGR